MSSFARPRLGTGGGAALAGAASLAALAVVNAALARRAERRHPPTGMILTVNGVRVHGTDEGHGSPVVLIHGNAVRGDDWALSGVAGLLRRTRRVIVFDRPGFGHSERPRGRIWTASEQADLLRDALRRLGVGRAVVVGHSWGTLVALALAERHPDAVAGLVLLSGYYFPTVRPDVLPAVLGALPLVGDVLNHTVSPLAGWLKMPLLKRAMFSPMPVPERFRAGYSESMALRPSQVRASSGDGALMIPGAAALRDRYGGIDAPAILMAGDGDRVVSSRMSERLAAALPRARLRIVPGAGHMVHYAVPGEVARAVEDVADAALPARPSEARIPERV